MKKTALMFAALFAASAACAADNAPATRGIVSQTEQLPAGQTITAAARLAAGKTYRISGSCGKHCGKLRLQLFNSSAHVDLYDEDTRHGALVGERSGLKNPSLLWTAAADADYTAVLTLTECAAAACAATLDISESSGAKP
jgi:lipoprotein